MGQDDGQDVRQGDVAAILREHGRLLNRITLLLAVLIAVFVVFLGASIWQSCSVQYVYVLDDTLELEAPEK